VCCCSDKDYVLGTTGHRAMTAQKCDGVRVVTLWINHAAETKFVELLRRPRDGRQSVSAILSKGNSQRNETIHWISQQAQCQTPSLLHDNTVWRRDSRDDRYHEWVLGSHSALQRTVATNFPPPHWLLTKNMSMWLHGVSWAHNVYLATIANY